MSVKISKIYTRPDESIPWHYEVLSKDAFTTQFDEVHLKNCTLKERITIDPLNVQFRIEWTSHDALHAYINDPILGEYWIARDKYNQDVGIIGYDPIIEHTT